MKPLTKDEQLALSLYSPPFTYSHGYIFDSDDNMVSDDILERNQANLTRIRGWGRISYMDNPEKLQDTVGELVAKALTEYWEKYNGKLYEKS